MCLQLPSISLQSQVEIQMSFLKLKNRYIQINAMLANNS